MASTVSGHRKHKPRKGFSVPINGAGGVLILGGALIAIGAAFLFRRCRNNKKTPPPSSSSPDEAKELHCKEANDGLIIIKHVDDSKTETVEDDRKIQEMEADDVVKTIVGDIKIQELKVKEADDLLKTIEDDKKTEEANESILPVVKLEFEDEETEAIASEEIGYNKVERDQNNTVKAEAEEVEHETDETEGSESSTEAVWPAELSKPELETVALQVNKGAELMTEVKEKLEENIVEGVTATMEVTGKYDYVNVLMQFLALLMFIVFVLLSVASFPSKG